MKKTLLALIKSIDGVWSKRAILILVGVLIAVVFGIVAMGLGKGAGESMKEAWSRGGQVDSMANQVVVSSQNQQESSESANKEEQITLNQLIESKKGAEEEKAKNVAKDRGITVSEDYYTKPEGELSKMMQKANILYQDGKVSEALEVFGNIALYSQTLANYNLGVIYLGNQDFKEAKRVFDMAIEGGDDVALSALNASYGAYKMGDQKSFKHYLELANGRLAESVGTPFYSYLYSLVSFYKNNYFETLSSLMHPNSKDYQGQNEALASEMLLMMGDDYGALEALKRDKSPQNTLALAMLYARNGEYDNAKMKVMGYLQKHSDDIQALSVMELVNLKLNEFADGGMHLASIEQMGKQPYFRIKAGLNEELFDINEAQKKFWNGRFESRRTFLYKYLFHYAPYQVFNAKQVLDILSEGGFDGWVGEIDEAKDAYVRGETISRVNRQIAQGLIEAYTGDIRKALEILLTRSNSQHSVLYYDIGLLYARLEDFDNAYSYFSKAYYLDNHNLMAGVFALMTGELIYQDVSKFSELVGQDLLNGEYKNNDERTFLNEIFAYASGGKAREFEYEGAKVKSIYRALQVVYAIENENIERIKLYSSKLKNEYPKDLTTEIMYKLSNHYGENLKKVSLDFAETFRRGGFSDMHSLYYGGSLTRELYIYLAFVTGNLSFAITHLQENLSNQEGSPIGTMQALGLAYIYNQEFEKAFAVYNDLIDNLKESDTKTKFLGAVAAIGAGHHSNAVALLQISKLDSVATLESRYALALLYQQTGNLKSAINLLLSIGNKGFVSEFFDFEIDTSEILQKAIE